MTPANNKERTSSMTAREATFDSGPARQAVTATPCRPIATFERDAQAIRITPPTCITTLAALRTRRHLISPDPERDSRIVEVPDRLIAERFNVMGEPSVACLAGLEPIVEHLLVSAGYTVKRRGSRRPSLVAPDLSTISDLGPVDMELLDLVRHHDRGLIRYDSPGVDIPWLIAQIALAFRKKKIAVLTAREEDVRRIARDLLEWLPNVCWATGRSQPNHVTRVIVSTHWAVHHPILRLWERDFLIFPDAVETLGKIARCAVKKAPTARLFGLIDRAHEPAPCEVDRLVGLFGIAEAIIPRHGHVERTVEVVTSRITGGPPLNAGLDVVALKRRGIWQHPVRNRRVARSAESLARGEPGPLASAPAIVELLATVPAPRVAIVVETVEHAVGLAQRLPDWPLLLASEVAEVGLSVNARAILARRRVGSVVGHDRVIVTLAALDAVPLGEFDALIRADGSTHLPEALATRLITAQRDRRPLVLVDLDDRHHPVLRRGSRARRAAYVERGWTVDGIQPPTAIERFLATRAEVTK
jgi:hypothetical protein